MVLGICEFSACMKRSADSLLQTPEDHPASFGAPFDYPTCIGFH